MNEAVLPAYEPSLYAALTRHRGGLPELTAVRVAESVTHVCRTISGEEIQLRPDMRLYQDLAYDSLDILDFLNRVEDGLGICFPEQEHATLKGSATLLDVMQAAAQRLERNTWHRESDSFIDNALGYLASKLK